MECTRWKRETCWSFRPVIKENVPYEHCVLWLYSPFLLSCQRAAGERTPSEERLLNCKFDCLYVTGLICNL